MSILKIVIADADRDFCKSLAEYTRFRTDMKIVGSSSDCGKVVQLIHQKEPNVVIMNLLLKNSAELLSHIQLQILTFSRVQSYMIVPITSGINDDASCETDPQLAVLPAYIRSILESNERQNSKLEQRVSELLRQLGVPAHIKGYQYLRKAIITVLKDPESINAVTKILYPDIAKFYGTSAGGVERSIRKAIEIAWDRGDVDCMRQYFGYTVDPNVGKPTNSEFIATVADILNLQQDHSELLACI